ncbi:dienelactone hydrolase family protein [Luteolibacter sp. GHJ8]|uniref:Dienelactone hydrolase family protein n=1 Tax=Luteolibacter rhizosphaerae TaxID=2989719 RepID=A0ABT3G0T6_9BACT|nr:transglutaminase domain-containing protein [Luteolibacter rhizosphaerae]MCW1913277.1 dienelactone hydrolase family protein [Luteolibacter rhizosphaerae]
MKWLPIPLALVSSILAAPVDDFITAAKSKHGEAGEKAAKFLTEHMPTGDKEKLDAGFLGTNLDLAFQARGEFPWAKQVPEEIFLNDVLPYAVFDETREAWRKDYLEKARPIVKDAKTASEAAQALNKEFFNLINVHYNTGRKAPNQSPSESAALSKATCTGLSIILVDVCRAVGIPARAVGTPLWANERGNHTWVEIWDGDWHFTGADEYDEEGLNRGWFVNDAAQAKADEPKYAIYATSWKKEGLSFPMVWAGGSKEVAAVNVTSRYAKAGAAAPVANVGIRLFREGKGERVVAKLQVLDESGKLLGEGETKAGTADMNDMPRVPVKPGTKGLIRFTVDGVTREKSFGPIEAGEPTLDAVWSELAAVKPAAEVPQGPLTKDQAAQVAAKIADERLATLREERKEEMDKKAIVQGDKTLRWLEKSFGEAPEGKRSLWISMHGGGGAPARVNDQQWQNQIRLYEPKEGIYVAPRAPTDTWDLWHQGHIDPMFQRLIEDYVALRGVSPDKIYLMGYSAGGDGVWQLAPRMADRFAAAAMMAGHPNEAQLDGLRNLPFAIFMGGADGAYDRNKIAAERAAKLDQMEKDDPGGYIHMSRIYEGLPHWMNGKDAEAVPWMANYTRIAWPKKIVWLQDDVTHDRFYWLKIPDKNAAKAGQKIEAKVEGQTITLSGDVPSGTELRLSDALLDLEQPLKVIVNGKEAFSGKVNRSAEAIHRTLDERADLPAAASAIVTLP